jgi:hypothetical protein
MPSNVVEPTHFRLPDMLSNWPWPRHLNPHYDVCKEESVAWLETFHAFSPKAQQGFNLCDFSGSRSTCGGRGVHLAKICQTFWPRWATRSTIKVSDCLDIKKELVNTSSLPDGCRVGCDLMNLFFVIDHHTDIADPTGARDQANVLMDVLRNPHMGRPAGEWIGGEVARQ